MELESLPPRQGISAELRREYEERYESVKRWRDNLASKSDYSFYYYVGDLIRFCQHTNMNPDELIKLRAENLKSDDPVIQHKVEEMLQEFVNRQKSPSRARTIKNAIASFFRHNYYRLGTIKVGVEEEEEEIRNPPKIEKLREILKRQVTRVRMIILFLLSSGMREGGFVKLRLLHFDGDDIEFVFEDNPTIQDEKEKKIIDVRIKRTPIHVYVPKPVNKGKRNGYDTFITGECGVEFVRYMKERIIRGERLTLRSFVVINEKMHKHPTQLLPASMFHVCIRAGDVIPSDLRDFFSSTLEKAKVPFSAVEQMMGHLSFFKTSAGSYKKFSVDELREFYTMAEPSLTIETVLPSKEVRMESELGQLRNEVEMLRNVVKVLVREVRPEIKDEIEQDIQRLIETSEEEKKPYPKTSLKYPKS